MPENALRSNAHEDCRANQKIRCTRVSEHITLDMRLVSVIKNVTMWIRTPWGAVNNGGVLPWRLFVLIPSSSRCSACGPGSCTSVAPSGGSCSGLHCTHTAPWRPGHTIVPGQDTTRSRTCPRVFLRRTTAWLWETFSKLWLLTDNNISPLLKNKNEMCNVKTYRN